MTIAISRDKMEGRTVGQVDRHLRECALCGWPFQAVRSDALYCSPACRQRAVRVADGRLSQKDAARLARRDRATKAAKKVYGRP
jgi:hypothetical protein